MFVRSEELFMNPRSTEKIFSFLRLEGFNNKTVAKMITKPRNPQRKGQFPKYEDWSDQDKKRLQRVTPLAEKYGYEL